MASLLRPSMIQLSSRLFNFSAARTSVSPFVKASSLRLFSTTFPDDRKYTKSHEWVKVEDDVATVGISNHAQEALGDIVFVELPEVGASAKAGDPAVTVESVKTSAEVYAPLNGEVVEVNEGLPDSPDLINNSPHDDGWMFKMKISTPSEVDNLMSSEAYSEFEKDS